MPKRRTSNYVTRIPLKFGDSVYNITSKKNKHKIDNAEGNKDSGCDEYDDESRDSVDEEDCTKEDNGDSGKQGYEMDDAQVRDEMRENVEESIESDKQSQSNVSPADPVTITTSNVENDVIKAKNDQMHEMHDNDKNNNESYAKIVRSGCEELNKDLLYIPTGINENRDEVVIFEKELVREGSKKWQLIVCGYFVGCIMPIGELRYDLRRMWGRHALFEIIAYDSDMRIFKFKNVEGMNYVIDQSPLMVNRKPLVV
ncbi:RNA-directed DNA polymerase, eukaryota, reverse transcriptase zinc-binding domain protein [Tanacetum coccineum]